MPEVTVSFLVTLAANLCLGCKPSQEPVEIRKYSFFFFNILIRKSATTFNLGRFSVTVLEAPSHVQYSANFFL